MKFRKFIITALVLTMSVAVLASCSRRPDSSQSEATPAVDPHDAESTIEKIEQEQGKIQYVDEEPLDPETMAGIAAPDDGTSGDLTEYQGKKAVATDYTYTVAVISSVSDSKLTAKVCESKSGAVLSSYENVDRSDYQETSSTVDASLTSETPVYSYDGSMWSKESVSSLSAGQMVIVVTNADGSLDSVILVGE